MADYMLNEKLNWEEIMKAPRVAGGHEDVMRVLFTGARVIAEWIESDYQGSEAFAYALSNGDVAILTDYFGSCSGCDSWEDAGDESVRHLCSTLANNAKIFGSGIEAFEYCHSVGTDPDSPENFSKSAAMHLAPTLEAFTWASEDLPLHIQHQNLTLRNLVQFRLENGV